MHQRDPWLPKDQVTTHSPVRPLLYPVHVGTSGEGCTGTGWKSTETSLENLTFRYFPGDRVVRDATQFRKQGRRKNLG